jgi:Holliday junction resolvase-like predicted endonuclease
MGEINAEFWSENVKIRLGQPKYSLEGGELDLIARRYHDVAFIKVKTTVDGLHKMRGASLLS